jgi:hypothetical protein
MFEQSFSQMPVYDGAIFVGLLTANTVARWLGASVAEDIFSLSETPVSDVLGYTEDKDNFSFLRRDSTLFEVLEKFQTFEREGKRLEAILITQNGKPKRAAKQLAEADVLIEVCLDADFGSESFCGLLGNSYHPHVQWLKNRASRKIMIQTKNKKVIHIEGYSVKQVEQVLETAEKITVIQTKSD